MTRRTPVPQSMPGAQSHYLVEHQAQSNAHSQCMDKLYKQNNSVYCMSRYLTYFIECPKYTGNTLKIDYQILRACFGNMTWCLWF